MTFPQKIIADGQSVWLYDIELEQVTVSPLAEQGAGTPLALLSGEKPLEQEFELQPLGQSDGIEWVELKPRSSDSDFELVYLGLLILSKASSARIRLALRSTSGSG